MEIAPGMVWKSLLLTVYILNAIQVAENLTMCRLKIMYKRKKNQADVK